MLWLLPGVSGPDWRLPRERTAARHRSGAPITGLTAWRIWIVPGNGTGKNGRSITSCWLTQKTNPVWIADHVFRTSSWIAITETHKRRSSSSPVPSGAVSRGGLEPGQKQGWWQRSQSAMWFALIVTGIGRTCSGLVPIWRRRWGRGSNWRGNLGATKRIVVWRSNPGPQTALLQCPVEDVFYGGARITWRGQN